jgi:hypothetical protein
MDHKAPFRAPVTLSGALEGLRSQPEPSTLYTDALPIPNCLAIALAPIPEARNRSTSETTTFNAQFGYINALEEQDFLGCASTDPAGAAAAASGDCKDKLYKVTANVMWQPVKQMRMGWEVNWGEYTRFDGTTEDGASALFATWFFF